MSRGRRRLTAEERALWRGVARSVKPLRSIATDTDDADEAPVAAPPAKPSAPPPAAAKPAPKPKPRLAPLAPLERSARQKLARGTAALDARLDLHGLTQAQAHAALARFLRRAQVDGARFVLVVTGKGRAEEPGGRGVLRRQVPLWLALPEFRALVVGFEAAGVGHGGEGALYVRLRRSKGS